MVCIDKAIYFPRSPLKSLLLIGEVAQETEDNNVSVSDLNSGETKAKEIQLG